MKTSGKKYVISSFRKNSGVKNRKKFFIAVALVAIVSVSLVSGALIFGYVYNFKVNIFRPQAPAELKRGSQTQVTIIVNYNMMNNPCLKNRIILSLSGSGASWASFATSFQYKNGTQSYPQIIISTPYDGVNLIIKIPNDAQTGSYEIIVKGTNSVGQISSDSYAFIVI